MLSSVLPNPEWMLTTLLGALAPALGALIARRLLAPWVASAGKRTARPALGWIIAISLIASFILIGVGPLGIRPALVTGVSMQPGMWAGDIILTRQVPAGDIRVGDVVRFRVDRVSIVHRVVEVEPRGGRYTFTMQGDNNDVLDEPVDESQLEGKVVLLLPKIGWIVIGIKHLIDRLS
ncbi:MAG: signal peptidase I [Chloroflexi bacterium]|nr:signal peptidase I [Chloroflexota bacterium]